MNCGENTIKYLIFVFNLVFSLCGLALLICGVLVQINLKNLSQEMQNNAAIPSIGVIVIGCIIFVIAFFGCCGAIRENHCMIITFAVFLLTILVIQIALSIYVFVVLKQMDPTAFKREYEKIFDEYWVDEDDQAIVDAVQTTLHCCGVNGPQDYLTMPHKEAKYPMSCCAAKSDKSIETCEAEEVYSLGCNDMLINTSRSAGKLLGGIVLGIAGVELIGIIFALCLANSIRNADRRAFRV